MTTKKSSTKIDPVRSAGAKKAWKTSVLLQAKMNPETRKRYGVKMPNKARIVAAGKKNKARKRSRR